MIGIWADYHTTYLLTLGTITTLFFALPLTFAPLHWARLMLWKLPQETDLALYFGRCVGVFVLIVEYFIFQSGLNGTHLAFTFELLNLVFTLMAVLHIYGAIKRIQPITETLEIGLWFGLLTLNLACTPV